MPTVLSSAQATPHNAESTRLQSPEAQLHFQAILLDHVTESLVVANLEEIILSWNKGAEALYGLSAQQALGQPVTNFLQVGPLQHARQAGSWQGELHRCHEDGDTFWTDTRITLHPAQSGQPALILISERDITERKHIEQAYLESETRYASMFHDSHDCMILSDPESAQVIDVNPAACAFYGYSREEFLQKEIQDIFLVNPEQLFHFYSESIQQHKNHYYVKHILADGQIRDVEVHNGPIPYANKTLLCSIVHDVTAHLQAAAALQKSERQLREMLENIQLFAVILDRQGRILFCNAFFARQTGWSREQVQGMYYPDHFIPSENVDQCRNFRILFSQNQLPAYIEYEILTSHGNRRRVAWNNTTLRDWDGQEVSVACIGEDITNRWRAQQALEQRVGELSALHKTGQVIASTLDLDEVLARVIEEGKAMIGCDMAAILLHNPEKQEIVFQVGVGLSKDDLVADHIPDHIGVAGWVLQHAQPVFLNDYQNDPRSQDVNFVFKDFVVHSLMAVPLVFQNQAIGVIEMFSPQEASFNEQKLNLLSTLAGFATVAIVNARLFKAEREQRYLADSSRAQLIQSEKLNAMGRLVASLAHEINNPLQSLRSGLSLLQAGNLTEAKQRQYLTVVARQVDRLTAVVERILGFYRPSQARPQQVNICAAVRETLMLAEKRLEEDRVVVKVILPENLPPVAMPSDQLSQIFLNLILNAAAAMPGGGHLEICAGWQPQSRLVWVSFKDNGIGILPEAIPHIFEPFYTTRPEGNGLGLSICYSMVLRYNGRIEVESEPVVGSTFTVFLPPFESA